MAGYAVRIKASVEKDIAALPGEVVLRILQDIEALSATPLPPGVCKLSGAEHLYRIGAGDYRLYTLCIMRSGRA